MTDTYHLALPEDLHRRLKMAAAAAGMSMRAAILKAISEWLDKREDI